MGSWLLLAGILHAGRGFGVTREKKTYRFCCWQQVISRGLGGNFGCVFRLRDKNLIDSLDNENTLEYMKTITVNVSDPIYRDFTVYAKQVGNSASELIRRAMEDYHQRFILRKTTLRNRRPASVGGPLQPIGREEDLLGEMLDDRRD